MASRALKPANVGSVQDALDERDALPTAALAKLRDKFADRQISKLPKETRAQIDARKAPNGKSVMVFNCAVCGGHHHKDAVHLDYVGHAALTDRLLDTDMLWSWEPVGFTPEGLPALDKNGGLWIKLTVCGVTRYGYGAADGKSGGDAIKEIIGDALRNAAMRFGAALDLWHKGDLHADDDDTPANPTTGETPPNKRVTYPPFEDGRAVPYTCPTQLMTAAREFVRTMNGMGDLAEFLEWIASPDMDDFVIQLKRDLPDWWKGGASTPEDFVPLKILVAQKKRDLEQIDGLKERA